MDDQQEARSIFEMAGEEVDDLWGRKEKHLSQAEQLRQVRELFAEAATSPSQDAMPDFSKAYRQAKNQYERNQVLAAKDAWLEAEQVRQFEVSQQAAQAAIQAVKGQPGRNKAFYNSLKASDPSTFYSREVQSLMKQDRQRMGLGFHLGK